MKKTRLVPRNLQYCTRCCMPETTELLTFDEMGICTACRASEEKMHIDWSKREKELQRLLHRYRSKSGDNYDCIVPISGGKDSTFQLHVICNVYGLKPLAVTFSHNWYSPVGKQNLENALEKFQVDHIMFTPNRALVNKLARKSLLAIGDACWHCHAGVGVFPLQIAVKFNIPLLVWGEPTSEGLGKSTYENPIPFNRDTFFTLSAKYFPNQMVDESITKKDVYPFQPPSWKEIKRVGVVGIYLGDYMFWDAERQVEFIKKEYGWKEDVVEGTYKKYKSVECIMPGVHDYTKFLKRGFGRTTDHASQDVRAGLLTREEGFKLIRQLDGKKPKKALKYYLSITGYTEKEFNEILADHRRKILRKKNG